MRPEVSANVGCIFKELRAGRNAPFEGVTLAPTRRNLEPGDTYIAERNLGPVLLTVERISDFVVYPKEVNYPYYLWECVGVEIPE